MLILDSANVYQKYPDCLETVCHMMMDHYNFMLGLSINTEIHNFFYQEEFDTFKFYDV
jgi:hypothetical protein